MSGLIGGHITGQALRVAQETIDSDDSRTERFEHGTNGVVVTSDPGDPRSMATWSDGNRSGVLYGVVTNLDELRIDHQAMFESLFDRPVEVASRLQGCFLIACFSADRTLVITDKLGTRPCYYSRSGQFLFGTAVAPILTEDVTPVLDLQAASDMLLMGHLWGDRTLVEGIQSIRPATVLEVTNGERSTARYWKPRYDEASPGSAYLDELADRYLQATARIGKTLPDQNGIWLSGGLDSRTTAAALLSADGNDWSLGAYTYDANPPTSDNPKLAAAVAETLNIELSEVPLSARTFADCFGRVIESTDGMMRWSTSVNLSPSYHLEPTPGVVMEGMQGELIGDHLLRPHLRSGRSPIESQYASEAGSSAGLVRELLSPRVDPYGSFRTELHESDEQGARRQILDIHFQNYYTKHTATSNRLMRDRFGTRFPHVDGSYLEWCARLPRAYRKGTFPLTGESVPYGTSRAKLELIRRIDPELSKITYERTKMKPSWPYLFHVAGFVGNVVTGRLRSKATYGSGQLADFWLRDRDSELHDIVKGLVDDACSRALFNADAVSELYSAHMNGENNVSMISQITTLERWIATHLD
ncbi:asparagine synthase-related protein [Halalkalirubrum salinum]|uniref:asparagine synthase-related protein n=1 Tax=Halalkalirubrum salinum TaxID=2563889 RepID=UPI0014853D2E|nr:asparagine synthase-related protein [Halalkalirubrum salinum]